eukprot:5639539-Prymnesium_polylepis.1
MEDDCAPLTLRPVRGGHPQVSRGAAKKCDIWRLLQDTEGDTAHVEIDFEPAPLRCAAAGI